MNTEKLQRERWLTAAKLLQTVDENGYCVFTVKEMQTIIKNKFGVVSRNYIQSVRRTLQKRNIAVGKSRGQAFCYNHELVTVPNTDVEKLRKSMLNEDNTND